VRADVWWQWQVGWSLLVADESITSIWGASCLTRLVAAGLRCHIDKACRVRLHTVVHCFYNDSSSTKALLA
jgi:hypothetical protein